MTAWHIVVFEGLIFTYLIAQNSCCHPHIVQIFGFLLILITAVHELPPYFLVKFSCPTWPILLIFSYQNYFRISELSL